MIKRRQLAALAVALIALSACAGSGTGNDATSPVEPAPAAEHRVPAPSTTLAPSGDDELDRLGAELDAAEEELAGLEQAMAAAGEEQ